MARRRPASITSTPSASRSEPTSAIRSPRTRMSAVNGLAPCSASSAIVVAFLIKRSMSSPFCGSDERLAAVDYEVLAGDVPGAVAREEDGERRLIGGLGELSERD